MSTDFDALRVGQDALPIIDISGLRSPRAADRRAVGLALRAACTDKGFFYIREHGIDAALQARVFKASRAFFALPMEHKRRVDMAHSPANRGYDPLRGQTLEAGAPPDLKESYYIGEERGPDDPKVRAGKFNHGPNQWPAEVPDFRPAIEAYYRAMTALSERIMAGLALSLDLREDFFADFCVEPQAIVRLLHYPPQPANPAPNEKGCGAHTDFGGITLLLQDDNAGLQVWDEASGGWLHADPIPGTYVVNLGDMIARWTNDRYRSTVHRVVNVSGHERYSVPFFYSGNPDHEVRCLPGCLAQGEQPKYPPVTVEQHIIDMYRRTYA
ncbi:MAG: isopenicillin N synthase family oxygenase [Alcanivorax sp.]|nr:isopenicillin N synthase family oxygenase [Alcanivorax sp.]